MDLAWQCKCGKIEYSDVEPDECMSCGKIGAFTQVPEELIEERMKDASENEINNLELGLEDEMELEMGVSPKSKMKASKTKSKPKLRKPKAPTRRKK
jgi:hypothetical protein